MTIVSEYDIRDRTLASKGHARIAWAAREMPVLRRIENRFASETPLNGIRIAACLHVTSETARLIQALITGGAQVRLCASNPLSTQDDVAAALVDQGVAVFARRGDDTDTYYGHLRSVLEVPPAITLDDGADLVSLLHQEYSGELPGILGGTEETTTGVNRLRAMARDNALCYPIIAVNDAMTKHLFDNRYGTGQSTMDGLLRATNVLIAGKTFVVAGYGWCSRGIAMRAKGEGAIVVVTEVNPLRALEAAMDGYRVMPMDQAAGIGDIFVTATGDIKVIDQHHIQRMKDGAILANSGHFNVEINVDALHAMAKEISRPRDNVTTFTLADERKIHLLAEGRLVNLAAAEGHPSAVMDMSFANQALCVEYLEQQSRSKGLDCCVHAVPPEIDANVARLKLTEMGLSIDTLTDAQREYVNTWKSGTS